MKTAFIFSGQGAQYPGMFKDLYEREACVREVFQCADDVLGRSITRLCFAGSQEELNLTHNTQPCVLAADLAAGAILKKHGIMPDCVAGFSLGEYAALVSAGVLNMSQAFEIVQQRADAMQAAVPIGKGTMAAVIGTEPANVEALCASITEYYVAPANYNSPLQTVIAGTAEGIDAAMRAAEEKGMRAMRLAVSVPSHCKLMESVAEILKNVLKNYKLSAPVLPIYMNAIGREVSEGIAELLVEQVVRPVRWTDTICGMRAAGVNTLIECGPGRTLTGLAKKTVSDVMLCRAENVQTLNKTLEMLV